MKKLLTIMGLLSIFLSVPKASAYPPDCQIAPAYMGLAISVQCGTLKETYGTIEQAMVRVYSLERHGQVKVDWGTIQASCKSMGINIPFCESL